MRNREFLRKKLNKGLIGFNVFDKGSFYSVVCGYRQRKFAFIQTTRKTIDYYGIKNLVNIRRECEREMDVPVFLHLDHGDKNLAIEAIKNGYDSVMVDYSNNGLKENIKKTNEVIEEAWKREVLVEAEVGELGGYSQVSEVKEFLEKTKVDSLAVSIGSKHGVHKEKIKPEYLLKFKELDVPLVLHGASCFFKEDLKSINKNGGKVKGAKGIEKSVLKECMKNGVKKLNMDSVLRLSYMAGIREHMKSKPFCIDAREIFSAGEERVYRRVKELVKEFVP